jgi:hypothetical protein
MNKQKKVKVKVLDANYDENKQIVYLRVINLSSKDEMTLAVPAVDVPSMVGKYRKEVLPSNVIRKFVHDIRGGEIEMFTEALISEHSMSSKHLLGASEEDLAELHNKIDQYPWGEVDPRNQVILRIFGSDNCENCKELINSLESFQVPHEFIDANADETQDFCDEQNVDGLPHIQILNPDGKMCFEHVGSLDVQVLLQKMVEIADGNTTQ